MNAKRLAITGLIREHAVHTPNKTALIVGDECLNYG